MIALLLSLVCATVVPVASSQEPIAYQFETTFYEDSDSQFLFRWNITDKDLVGQLSLQSPALDWSWVAIGFGSNGMLHSQMIVCHNLNNGSVELHEHIAGSQYLAPAHDDGELIVPIAGFAQGSNHTCSFRRPLLPSNRRKTQLYASQAMKMIWAFNPVSGKNYKGKYFTVHSTTHRGAVSLRLSDGAALPATVPSFKNRQIHGFGMMSIWLFVLPFGAFYARYFRFVSGWVIVKIINQTCGIILTLVFLYFALIGEARFDMAHSFLGIAILVIMFAQIIMGVLTVMGMSNESLEKFKAHSRLAHMLTGYTLFAMAIAQVVLGLDMLYPWVEPRRMEPWAAFFALIGMWVIAFASLELNLRLKAKREDPGFGKEVEFPLMKADELEKTQHFTWETLDEEIRNGKMYVVGNGKYVYDISQWIGSHPGGQIILHNVNGTDISNDYFHEAGFDAEEFTPSALPPPKRLHDGVAVAGLSRADVLSAKRSSLDSFSYRGVGALNDRITPNFDQQDWSCIQRARRTHVHTKLALQKLATLVVGKLRTDSGYRSPSTSVNTLNTTSDISFSPHEYRRYAMTRKEMESSQGATKPFVKFRFCLLYPYDIRQDQPSAFIPGQAVEIQVRLSDGTRVSRYYTPISGDMTNFEILVKIQPTGPMSRYLFASEPGERQFKIRGPFGNPLLPRQLTTLHPEDSYDTIYFFAGGSGVTPFLQICNNLLLTKKIPLMVHLTDVDCSTISCRALG
jgi:hypothetical protein